MMWIQILCCYVVTLSLSFEPIRADTPVWRWECVEGYCQKRRVLPGEEDWALSLAACQLLCSGSLWPLPTGNLSIGHALVDINLLSIDNQAHQSETPISALTRAAVRNFLRHVKLLSTPGANTSSSGRTLIVNLHIANPVITQLTLETDESYSLAVVETPDDKMNASISAETFFGARLGLETLSQLIIYDDIRKQFQMPNSVFITDKPVYPYRGVMLDTARNYISVETIKRTIEGIAASKLNTFHWHITDSQSFPYVSKSNPQLSKLGAYSKRETYSPKDIEDIIQFAKERGVRVLPEFDAPAHVGEGWQDTDFVTCFNQQPFQDFCPQPPCGQFDPTKPKLYDTLEGIYKDMIEQFNPDIFHMGGDEVSMACWNSTPSIVEWMQKTKRWGRSEEDFVKLWDLFQSQALERFDRQAGKKLPIIMWTSTLTKIDYVERYLPKDRYIIQVWTTRWNLQLYLLLWRGYRLILSNYDALYLDCGFASWTSEGNNWCSPYKGWQKIYNNSPAKIGGAHKDQFLGGEAPLWTEQVDDTAVDSRIWPRAAALAERLWAEPKTKWRAAEPRMLIHRDRIVKRGIGADALEPTWCLHNQENCPIGGKFNRE